MPRLQEIFRGKADILGNLSKQRRRDVPALMERDGRPASVSVSVLSVGASLANFDEAQPREERVTSRGLRTGILLIGLRRFGCR